MHASFVELSKYLVLESKKGYNDKTIVGGFERLLPAWKTRAQDQGADEETIQYIVQKLDGYAKRSLDERKAIILDLTSYLQKPTAKTQQEEPGAIGHKAATCSPVVRSYQPKAVFAPITVIQGVGEKMALKLRKLNLRTLYDLLHYYPRRYNDYSRLTPIRDLQIGDECTISGAIQSIQKRKAKTSHLQMMEAIVGDGTGSIWITWFNQPWLTNRLNIGTQIVASGKVDRYMGRVCLNNPEWEPVNAEHLHTNRIVPVYPLTAGIQQKWLREKIFQAIHYWSERINDYLPESIRRDEHFPSLNEALKGIHFPQNQQALANAIERLSFDELFFMQLGVIRQKREWQALSAAVYSMDPDMLEKEIISLPYILTTAQRNALQEIQHDLASGNQMNRLLQGDVGSGKTVVARFAMEIVIRNGKQAAFLAPTAILAQQHFDTLSGMFWGDEILKKDEIALLIGDTPEKEKTEIRGNLAAGKIKLVIGTHALLEDPVEFQELQIVVIDEQHRFGVEQRSTLRMKGNNPHILIMSATPIPRSLNLTVYGDLDISTLTELPGGRIPVKTYLLFPQQKFIVYEKIKEQVEAGHQAFIVYPQIEGDEEEQNSLAVLDGYEQLVKKTFPQYRIGLLHGRMKQEEKDAIMTQFRNRALDILASTSVIEVGMDIPNATLILVEGANHFGLAQLHQLRGRVGRGDAESFCYLIPDEDSKMENERLKKMTQTNDGFELAEFDLKTRGPGDFFGTRQSGYGGLNLANISDIKLINRARIQATRLLETDPELQQEDHQALKYELENLWKARNGELS